MYAEVVKNLASVSRSNVEFAGRRPFAAVEEFYQQSEQRPARFFTYDEEDFVLISAQPGCDMEWFEALTTEAVKALDQTETLSLLEKRSYHWECGCSLPKMYDVLTPVMKSDAAGLFGEEALIRMRCPRCGMRYVITREAMEAHLVDLESKSQAPS
jgi:molecular chaperone Hsp33